ncbi:MAG: oxidoreductase [Nakamurella sp.]
MSESGAGTEPRQSIFDAAGGTPFFEALAHAWHERCLADPVVSHAFSHGFHPDHGDRLAAYWAESVGGPATFSRHHGDETAVLRMHAGNGEHVEMDRRAEGAFDAALAEVGSPVGTLVGDTLSAYFRWANVRMAAHHHGQDEVAPGQSIPRWSWDGPATNGAIREK